MRQLVMILIPIIFLTGIVLFVSKTSKQGNVETRHPCETGDCSLEQN